MTLWCSCSPERLWKLFIFKQVLSVTASIQQRPKLYTVFPSGFSLSYRAASLCKPCAHTDQITCWDTDQTLKRTGASHKHMYLFVLMTHKHVPLTGVKEDHGLEADVLPPSQFELSHPGCGSDQHVKDLHEALHAAPLFSVEQAHKHNWLSIRKQTRFMNHQFKQK